MTTDLHRSARNLLVGDDDAAPSAAAMADRAVRALEQLTEPLSRIVGRTGVMTVLSRSIVLTVRDFPWLIGARVSAAHGPEDAVFEALRKALALQPPERLLEGFVAVLSTFIALLGRLIGDGLVWRLAKEVWPAIVQDTEKETP